MSRNVFENENISFASVGGNGKEMVCGWFDVKKMRSPATSEKKSTQTARALFCCVGGCVCVWGGGENNNF